MCELFGFSGSAPKRLNRELKEFFSHSDEHPNGWGLAILNENGCSIEKEPIKAKDSRYLQERLRAPIVETTVLAHIRLATIGKLEWNNCHPFTRVDCSGRRWTLIHNGTIFECAELEGYFPRQSGSTDSERILLYLIDCINAATEKKGMPLDSRERFEIVDQMVVTITPENKVNLLIYDGQLLYAHTNSADMLYSLQTEEGTMFSTRPLSFDQWKPVTFTTLIAYHQGKLVYTGTNHGNEYVLDQKKMELLLLAYSEL